MSDEKQIEIIKRGETSLTMSLNRGPSGLVVAVKVHPVVEAFIRLSEVDLCRLRERSGRRDLNVRIPDAVTDIRMADRQSLGAV